MSDRKLRMTMEQYGIAIRAAFEEGYIQGVHHPRDSSPLNDAKRIAAAFWTRVCSSIDEARKAGAA